MAKDWRCGERFFEIIKRRAGFFRPLERDTLFEKISEGCSDLAVFLDKSPVEIGESEKDLNVMRRLWFRPGRNCFHFDRVHANAFRRNDESQEGHLLGVEHRLLWLEVEACVLQALED